MSLLTPMMRTSPLTAWFSDAQRVQGMLDFEAALARAQVACGLVPQAALNPIIETCRHEKSTLPRWGWLPPAPGIWRSRW
jgi:3-carboxy-cis,cis-muconate cycloisomerase